MSKKALKLAGRRPMLLALIVMATLTLGLLFSGWLTPTPGKAQGTGGPEPMALVETTNCETASTATTCTEASVSFGASSVAVCGLPITVSVSLISAAGQVVTDTSYTNTGNSGSSACPDTYTTNNPAPTIISRSWVDTSANYGTGLSASFVPTTQSSSVTFTVVWQHVCDANYATNTTSVPYTVQCPTITSSTFAGNPPTGYYGAIFDHDLSCQAGWWTWENVTWDSDDCGQNTNGIKQQDVAGQMSAGSSLQDLIDNVGTPSDSCSSVTTQTTYFALVGGGSMTNNNSVCSIVNTQTITVTQTNSGWPAHGKIVTTVTVGGGGTHTSYY